MRMKMLARSYVWCPHIDKEVEALVKFCVHCQEVQPCPSLAPHYAGPFMNRSFFVIVDTHSKWPEIIETKALLMNSDNYSGLSVYQNKWYLIVTDLN